MCNVTTDGPQMQIWESSCLLRMKILKQVTKMYKNALLLNIYFFYFINVVHFHYNIIVMCNCIIISKLINT